jgi:putative peptide zinc metalloprotease protein
LYSVLKPYRLESLGVMMVVVSFGGMIGRFFYQVIKMVRAPHTKPLSRKRMAISAVVIILLLAGLAAVPVPVYVEAVVLIQSHNVRHVHTQVPGTIEVLNVQPGDSVREGDSLLKLSNPELQDQLRALESDVRVQKQRRDTALALSDPAQKQLAENHLRSLQAQIDELRQQLARLTIDAPVAGTVIAPESVPEPTLEPGDDRLSLWYGHPLQKQNIGSFLEARTHVLSLAPDKLLEAVLYIDQTDRNELAAGNRIRLKFDHLPDRIFEGDLADLSAQPVAYVPTSLSNKSGGPLATVTEPDGRERLTSVAWQARVVLDSETGLFLSGFRGRARLVITRRSAGGWLWSWLRETIHFRL